MIDQPNSQRASAEAERRIEEQARELRDYRLTQKRCDEQIKELEAALADMVDDYAGLRLLAADPVKWERVRQHVLDPSPIPVLARARRALSGAGDDKGDRG